MVCWKSQKGNGLSMENQKKPGREEQADHKLIGSFPDVPPEVHEDSVIWLQQLPLDPAQIVSSNSLTQHI
jgi:hypothetical protein